MTSLWPPGISVTTGNDVLRNSLEKFRISVVEAGPEVGWIQEEPQTVVIDFYMLKYVYCMNVFLFLVHHFHTIAVTVTVEVSNKVHQCMVQSPEFESILVTLAFPCNNFLQCTFNLQLDWIILCFCDYKCFFEDE